MPRLCLEDARPEMVLAADVRDRNGRLLLAAGQALTARVLRTFRMWGVTEVDVPAEGDADGTSTVEPSEIPADVLARIDSLFRHTDRSHPLIAMLQHVAVHRLGCRLEQGALR